MNKLADNEDSLHPIRLYLWPHRLLMLGPGFDTDLHRHHAAQICVGLAGPLRLRTERADAWLEHDGFYVPPDHPHEFAVQITGTAIMYVEPESAEFSALKKAQLARREVTPVTSAPRVIALLRELVKTEGTIEQADETCREVLG